MMREETVFGPIFSRRLGNSLGINLLPRKGKICNFDCVYCECGWNADGREDTRLPSAREVREALEERLQELSAQGTAVDSITFSGDGEPTLNPAFPQIVRETLALRDRYYPKALVSVLSNATRAGVPEIRAALQLVDNPILKLDAATDAQAALINQPVGHYSVAEVVEALKAFDGQFVLQTMFLRGDGWATEDWVKEWMDLVRELRPREVMVYTLDREAPMAGLRKYTVEEMRRLVQPLLDEGYKIQIKG